MSSSVRHVIHGNSRKKLKSSYRKSSTYAEDLSTKCLNALFFTVEKYVASLKFTLFKENFMDIYKSNPDHLEDIYKQFEEQILLVLKGDVHEIYTADEISILLSSLDKIVWKNNCDKMYRRYPQKRRRAGFYLDKKENVEDLNSRLNKLELCNDEREDEILRNHGDILILRNRIQNLNQELMEELDKLYEIAWPVTG